VGRAAASESREDCLASQDEESPDSEEQGAGEMPGGVTLRTVAQKTDRRQHRPAMAKASAFDATSRHGARGQKPRAPACEGR